jgi:hypothetical protein
MAYLAEASELLGQPREVALAAATVDQIVVPRLGPWCGVQRDPRDGIGGEPANARPHAVSCRPVASARVRG